MTRHGLAARRLDVAVEALSRASELSHGSSQADALLGAAYARKGDRHRAEAVLATLLARRNDGYVPATSLATIENALGRADQALHLLQRAHIERDVRMTFLRVDRRWDNLRGNRRFVRLAEEMGLPEPSLAACK